MSLQDQIQASADDDLRDRLIAAAFEAGAPNPAGWVDQRRRELATAPVADGGPDTVASVYAYAVSSYNGRPGQDPTKVTDDHLRHAVHAVLAQGEPAPTDAGNAS